MIYVVAILIISDIFAEDMQALAGAVINTIAQFGASFGIALMAIISTCVNNRRDAASDATEVSILPGYRAVFWTSFALTLVAAIIGAIGLRKVGRVGQQKADTSTTSSTEAGLPVMAIATP